MDFRLTHSFLWKPVNGLISFFSSLFHYQPQTYIKLSYYAFDNQHVYFETLNQITITGKHKGKTVDIVDGMILSPNQHYLIIGRFTETVPYKSTYKSSMDFYHSVPLRSEDYVTVQEFTKLRNDHIKRYNSYNPQSPFFSWNNIREFVSQDIYIPVNDAVKFMDFYHKNLAIVPLWVYPTAAINSAEDTKINFKFQDTVPSKKYLSDYYFNRLVDKQVRELNGS